MSHTCTLGLTSGPRGRGYYYSFYPDQAEVADVYTYLHSNCALIGTTNGSVFARARAVSPRPELAVVVGSYNPLPCNTAISLADVFSPGSAVPIDENEPALADGSLVGNCETGPWKNLLHVAAARQGVDRIWLTADMPASVAALSKDGLGAEILERIAAHRPPDMPLPIANVIIGRPEFTEDDGYTNEESFEGVYLGILGNVDDALQAAGYQTVLTYDHPREGSGRT